MHILALLSVSILLYFGTNKESRPFGVFVGFNHFREIVVFCAILMYDETFESFKWVFETFLRAHNGKQPKKSILIKIMQWENLLRKSFQKHGMVYDLMNIKILSTQSVLKRWT